MRLVRAIKTSQCPWGKARQWLLPSFQFFSSFMSASSNGLEGKGCSHSLRKADPSCAASLHFYSFVFTGQQASTLQSIFHLPAPRDHCCWDIVPSVSVAFNTKALHGPLLGLSTKLGGREMSPMGCQQQVPAF